MKRLPANGAPAQLPSIGDAIIDSANGQTSPMLPLTKQGRFANTLLGQTIALSLNVRVHEQLKGFPLSLEFCTQQALAGTDKIWGTADDEVDASGVDGILNSGDEKQRFAIPAVVFEALCSLHLPQNIDGLLELANRALAGQSTGPATIDEVQSALETINRAFNGGRFCVECN